MWGKKKKGTTKCDKITVKCVLEPYNVRMKLLNLRKNKRTSKCDKNTVKCDFEFHNVRMEPSNMTKNKKTTKCNKRTVTCNVGTAQYKNEIVNYEDKIVKY